MKLLRPCLVTTALLLALSCAVYPAAVTAIARLAFPRAAEGSVLVRDGRVVGSSLVGQAFADPAAHPAYFWGRPSAASVDKDTGVLVSGGSNLGPLNAALADDVAARVKLLRDAGVVGPIPADLVTRSASGLDPHLSPDAALVQVGRVARARGLPEWTVRQLVAEHTEPSTFGLLGAPRVNVLELDLALDRLARPPAPPVAR
ncbi:MAG TPA: potassium-transporting ATPase subunit KdpC [Minicystis sp.]|nr:potassium-transporting ATPase subunit KdpC [Minicystis sp.]